MTDTVLSKYGFMIGEKLLPRALAAIIHVMIVSVSMPTVVEFCDVIGEIQKMFVPIRTS